MKKLWPQHVEEEKQVGEQKLYLDKARDRTLSRQRHQQNFIATNQICSRQRQKHNFVMTNQDFVATKAVTKLCRDKPRICREKGSNKTLSRQTQKQNFVATNLEFVTIKRGIKLYHDKSKNRTLSRQTQILLRQTQRHCVRHPEC